MESIRQNGVFYEALDPIDPCTDPAGHRTEFIIYDRSYVPVVAFCMHCGRRGHVVAMTLGPVD